MKIIEIILKKIGHDYSHRVMNYKDGKLDGLSAYYDKDLNPVLLEWYEDGVLIEQERSKRCLLHTKINYTI